MKLNMNNIDELNYNIVKRYIDEENELCQKIINENIDIVKKERERCIKQEEKYIKDEEKRKMKYKRQSSIDISNKIIKTSEMLINEIKSGKWDKGILKLNFYPSQNKELDDLRTQHRIDFIQFLHKNKNINI